MAKRVCKHVGKFLFLGTLFGLAVIQKTDAHALGSAGMNYVTRLASSTVNIGSRTGPVPSCTNITFCVDTPYYPSDLVDVLLHANGDLKYLATVDAPLDPYRQDYSANGEALCRSQEMVVTPKTALSADGRWMYVVNYKEYVQAVRVEVCIAENRPCKFIDGFSDGWTTVCKQTYIYRQLIAITMDGRIAPQMFKLPASCKCYVKYTGDLFRRLNGTGVIDKLLKISPTQKNQR